VASMVVTWAIVARSFHYSNWCGIFGGIANPAESKFVYGPGFALFVSGWVAAVLGFVTLFATFVAGRVTALKANTVPVRIPTVLFAFFLFVSLVFCIIGCFLDIARKQDNTGISIDVTWWRAIVYDVDQTQSFKVEDVLADCKGRFRAGEAFTVMSCVFTGLSFLLGVLQFRGDDAQRVPASAVGIVASFFQLITWAMGVAIYHKSVCSNTVNFARDDFELGAGLGLYIAAFCFTLVFSIVNLVA